LKDIRDLSGDTEEYRQELKKRWSSLLSYRYIGRNHSSMNTGPVDNTVTLRHDMRNAAGGIMVAPISISSPEGSGRSDLVAVPNPVIHSCQILDDARDVHRIEVFQSQVLKEGKTRASAAEDRRRRQPRAGSSLHRGSGAILEPARRSSEEGY
jgi:hypothetical protein